MKLKQRGVIIVEFIIVLPFILLLLSSIIYFGMVLHDLNTVNAVSREAARLGVVGTSKYSTVKDLAHTRANEQLTALYRVALADVVIKADNDPNLANEKSLDVEITAHVDRSRSVPIINKLLPETLVGHTRMRIEVEAPKEDEPKPTP